MTDLWQIPSLLVLAKCKQCGEDFCATLHDGDKLPPFCRDCCHDLNAKAIASKEREEAARTT